MPSKLKRTEKRIGRREFLLRAGAGAAGAAGLSALTFATYSQKAVYHPPEKIYTLSDFRKEPFVGPKLVIVHGKEPYAMVKAAVDRLGGVARLIKRGDRVVIKPNVAWDRTPEQAANTNPEVVAAVARLAIEAGAGRVTVTDVSLNDPYRCFARSGIEEAAIGEGAAVFIPGSDDFLLTDMKGALLTEWPVASIYHEADILINIPIVKHHSLSGCTLAMKNWYGVIGGQRNRLHQDIHTSIADLAQAVRPTLTVMDATRVLMRNGPTGGSLSDVAIHDTIAAGFDEVAIDAWAMGYLNLDPRDIKFMALAEERGLGVIDWKGGAWDELTVAT